MRDYPDMVTPQELRALAEGLENQNHAAEETARLFKRTRVMKEAMEEVVSATRDYLPPDGIGAQECLNRILAATDNPTINAALRLAKGEEE